MYKFELPIGDWSKDGHNMCDYYLIRSNVHVEECVEPYIEACKKWRIHELCHKFNEDYISDDVIKFLIDEGFGAELFKQDDYSVSSLNLAKIVISSIMKIDPKIQLEVINEHVPLFCNWLGQKVKGVSEGYVFSLPGYGIHTM